MLAGFEMREMRKLRALRSRGCRVAGRNYGKRKGPRLLPLSILGWSLRLGRRVKRLAHRRRLVGGYLQVKTDAGSSYGVGIFTDCGLIINPSLSGSVGNLACGSDWYQ